jgi:hypothetical protein
MNKILGRSLRVRFKHFLRKLAINKRQKFIVFVLILSLGFFITEYLIGKSGIFLILILSVLTDLFLFISLKEDLKDNFSPQVFILPFFYTLAVGLFYLLVPARLLTRVGISSLYALGLYSLFLSENIFTVSSIRTIQLLSGARTVATTLTLLSYFFLSNVIFSFHINVFLTLLLISLYTFPIALHLIWTNTLEKNILSEIFWVLSLTICLVEVSLFLWFWPSSPTLIALFLTGIFYIIVGLTQAWFEKRLFRSVILEYLWVAFVMFIALVLFTSWK